MKDNTSLKAIILVAITCAIVLISLFLKYNNNKNTEGKINIVTNPSSFYTVNSCVYRYITYLSNEDVDNLLLILDKKYIKENKIDKNNVLHAIGIEENSTFISRKMYYQVVNSNITKYYVSGYIQPNDMIDEDGIATTETYSKYFIVYLDNTNSTFAISPYDGKLFLDGDTNE